MTFRAEALSAIAQYGPLRPTGLFLGARMGTPITVFIIKGNIETMLETVNKIQGTFADKAITNRPSPEATCPRRLRPDNLQLRIA